MGEGFEDTSTPLRDIFEGVSCPNTHADNKTLFGSAGKWSMFASYKQLMKEECSI